MKSNVEIPDDIQGLELASKKLDEMMAADAAGADGASSTPAAEAAAESATTEAQRAAQAGNESVQDPNLSSGDTGQAKTDTSAAADPNGAGQQKSEAEKKAAAAAAAAPKPGERPGDKSRFAKNQERLQGGWKDLNTGKETLKTERAAFERDKQDLERQRLEFQAEREKAEDEFKPEQYEDAAKKFEEAGNFDLAEMAKKKAEQLRRNPPAQRRKQAAEALETQRKEWTLKAGQQFPELAKDKSPLQLRVAQLLHEEPDLKTHPKGMFVAARIASLEAEAAHVSTLKGQLADKEKELGQLRTKVKELEVLTAPGGPGNATTPPPGEKTWDQMSDDDKFLELQREARDVGILTR